MADLDYFHELPVVSGPPWPGLTYLCTTRAGGVSQGDYASLNLGEHTADNPLRVRENRQRLASLLPAAPHWIQQVHGVMVHDLDCEKPGRTASIPQADALVTSRVQRVLAIMTADCLPVVLGSTDGRLIGIAHAGWRGLAGGVLENTLEALAAKDDEKGVTQWRAWIGPGISQAYFEVGDDVREAFVSDDTSLSTFFQPGKATGKWQADLPGIARQRLMRWGVGQIDSSDLCTYERADLFYSYRRAPQTGRLATLVWRTAAAA